MSAAGLTIVIGSYLEPDQVARIAEAPAAGRVSYLDNLGRLAAGEPLRNRYDPARGY